MTSPSIRLAAMERLAHHVPTVIVEVVASRGSVPRDAGTRMLVGADDQVGTIGGGNLEWRALATARAMLADATLRPADESIALGASLGQCCGGAVTLRYRMLDAASLAAWSSTVAVPTIQIYGAGHVGRAIVRVLEPLDVDVQWIDERASEFPVESSAAHIARVCVEPVEAEVAVAPAGSFYLVLTHRHDLDLRIVEAILKRGDFAFLGLIGSTTKRRRFQHLLTQRGFDPALLSRMTCPIGIDIIRGKEPTHIAISAAAQLLPLLEAWTSRSTTRLEERPKIA
jgi:xanthine dehydrogenase accessory factor